MAPDILFEKCLTLHYASRYHTNSVVQTSLLLSHLPISSFEEPSTIGGCFLDRIWNIDRCYHSVPVVSE